MESLGFWNRNIFFPKLARRGRDNNGSRAAGPGGQCSDGDGHGDHFVLGNHGADDGDHLAEVVGFTLKTIQGPEILFLPTITENICF